jgi:phage baseplate assembly protein W
MSNIIWKDFNIELEKSLDGDIKAKTNADSIMESVKNICKTFQGSRRMVPEFALPIYGILFEPIDSETASEIGHLLLQAIEDWEDRIKVENVHVVAVPDENRYEILLKFIEKTSNERNVLNFVLEGQA